MNDKHALIPEYMQQFKCIGGDCEDTCCAFWKVDVDKGTFFQYQKVDHPELKKQLQSDVIVNKANDKTNEKYAFMRLNPKTGGCSFHVNGLCSIQANLGEAYLSKTCSTYPRKAHDVNGAQEVSAVLSCPEAARLALLNPKGIEFTYVEAFPDDKLQYDAKVSTGRSDANLYAKHFWEMRTLAIEILQNRQFSLPQRTMQLAVLADRIDEESRKRAPVPIKSILDQYREELAQGQSAADSGIFPTNHLFQLRFTNDLLLTILEKRLWHNLRFKECLDHYLEGMRLAGSEKTEEILAYYESVHNEYFVPFMSEHEYILENYLVHHVFSSLFPLCKEGTLFDEVHYIGALYSLIRMQLIGMAAYHNGITTDIAVKLIQSFTKNFEHSNNFKQEIRDKSERESAHTLGHLSLLVMF